MAVPKSKKSSSKKLIKSNYKKFIYKNKLNNAFFVYNLNITKNINNLFI